MATKKRSEAEIQAEINEVDDKIDMIDEEIAAEFEAEEEQPKKARKTKKGELKVVETEEVDEKKTIKERAKEFGENHPKVCKWGKRIATGAAVVAAGLLGYKAGQDSMIEYDDIDDLDILEDTTAE